MSVTGTDTAPLPAFLDGIGNNRRKSKQIEQTPNSIGITTQNEDDKKAIKQQFAWLFNSEEERNKNNKNSESPASIAGDKSRNATNKSTLKTRPVSFVTSPLVKKLEVKTQMGDGSGLSSPVSSVMSISASELGSDSPRIPADRMTTPVSAPVQSFHESPLEKSKKLGSAGSRIALNDFFNHEKLDRAKEEYSQKVKELRREYEKQIQDLKELHVKEIEKAVASAKNEAEIEYSKNDAVNQSKISTLEYKLKMNSDIAEKWNGVIRVKEEEKAALVQQIQDKESVILNKDLEMRNLKDQIDLRQRQFEVERAQDQNKIQTLEQQLRLVSETREKERAMMAQEVENWKKQFSELKENQEKEFNERKNSMFNTHQKHQEWLAERRMLIEAMTREREEISLIRQDLQLQKIGMEDLDKQLHIRKQAQESEILALRAMLEKGIHNNNVAETEIVTEKTNLYHEKLRLQGLKETIDLEKASLQDMKKDLDERWKVCTRIEHEADMERQQALNLYEKAKSLAEKLDIRLHELERRKNQLDERKTQLLNEQMAQAKTRVEFLESANPDSSSKRLINVPYSLAQKYKRLVEH